MKQLSISLVEREALQIAQRGEPVPKSSSAMRTPMSRS
jgi:hypothetical protein